MSNQSKKAPNQTFGYIQQMLIELRIMSESENAPVLAYLIEMAIIEVKDMSDGIHVVQGGASGEAGGLNRNYSPPNMW